ncbi:hypothetical protein IHE44_0001690 [Lamprotornis superbus]|uniref:LIM zinc-binding domain-containing protein n=1 Tax=Lamprotornis superbus TaxID=245042 RepID=A0A835NTW5_9PASS|nr:hypothetical protein IHE44_0001690 [Lamprotornis superbus]
MPIIFKGLPRDPTKPSGFRSVKAPTTKVASSIGNAQKLPMCEKCGTGIVGMFVKIRDKQRHPECYVCSDCGTNLKQKGHFFVEDKIYCEKHARERVIPPEGYENFFFLHCTVNHTGKSEAKVRLQLFCVLVICHLFAFNKRGASTRQKCLLSAVVLVCWIVVPWAAEEMTSAWLCLSWRIVGGIYQVESYWFCCQLSCLLAPSKGQVGIAKPQSRLVACAHCKEPRAASSVASTAS